MYAIDEGTATINEVPVKIFGREVVEAFTAIRVDAGTTGYKGSCLREAGGRTFVSLNFLGGDFLCSPVLDEEKNVTGMDIAICGDDGLCAIMKALEFIHEAINDQRFEVDD